MARRFGYLGGKRTDQMLPPALGLPASIYPLKGADPATARKWLARATIKPSTLVLYANNTPQGVGIAQTLAHNLKQIGIDVHVKSFYYSDVAARVATPGGALRPRPERLDPRLHRSGQLLRPTALPW